MIACALQCVAWVAASCVIQYENRGLRLLRFKKYFYCGLLIGCASYLTSCYITSSLHSIARTPTVNTNSGRVVIALGPLQVDCKFRTSSDRVPLKESREINIGHITVHCYRGTSAEIRHIASAQALACVGRKLRTAGEIVASVGQIPFRFEMEFHLAGSIIDVIRSESHCEPGDKYEDGCQWCGQRLGPCVTPRENNDGRRKEGECGAYH